MEGGGQKNVKRSWRLSRAGPVGRQISRRMNWCVSSGWSSYYILAASIGKKKNILAPPNWKLSAVTVATAPATTGRERIIDVAPGQPVHSARSTLYIYSPEVTAAGRKRNRRVNQWIHSTFHLIFFLFFSRSRPLSLRLSVCLSSWTVKLAEWKKLVCWSIPAQDQDIMSYKRPVAVGERSSACFLPAGPAAGHISLWG